MDLNVLLLVIVSVQLSLIKYSYGHSYKMGLCPTIESVPTFDVDKFLGKWYALRKTSTASRCQMYYFNRTENPNELVIDQFSQISFGISRTYQYEGRVNILDPLKPSNMTVQFPWNAAGNASYIVFYIDDSMSDNYVDSSASDGYQYAALHTCQRMGFTHRQSTTILSRTKEIDSNKLNEILALMKHYGLNPYDLSIISQVNCPNYFDGTKLVDIKIDDQTLTAHTAANVVRKLGYHLADGVEYVGLAVNVLHRTLNMIGGFFKNYAL